MDRNSCEHKWKIDVGAKHQINASFPAIYICEKCGFTMEASSVIQLQAVNSMNALRNSVNELKDEIHRYSDASNKHANAIKWLTGGLVFIGLAQIVVILILNFR